MHIYKKKVPCPLVWPVPGAADVGVMGLWGCCWY